MTNEDKIPLRFKEDIKQIYVTGAFGGFTPYDFRLDLYIDTPELLEEIDEIQIIRKVENEVIMSVTTAKELSMWLAKRVKEYEDKFGEIKTTSDVEEKDTK
ncbi:MAG: DUF3467 domain-containing protein [Methanobacteriaceae archaeon]|jgi:hypothetical protein|nr:DUF3467 domain-containing protein [Methanobacteriaceae archaeon]